MSRQSAIDALEESAAAQKELAAMLRVPKVTPALVEAIKCIPDLSREMRDLYKAEKAELLKRVKAL
jgi:hypothetical protein